MLSNFERRMFINMKKEERICSICIEEILVDDCFITTCGHIFHKICIKDSYNVNKKCPDCRALPDDKFDPEMSFIAIKTNNIKDIQYMLTMNKIDIGTSIRTATEYDRYDIIKLLLEKSEINLDNAEFSDNIHKSINIATCNGNLPILKELLALDVCDCMPRKIVNASINYDDAEHYNIIRYIIELDPTILIKYGIHLLQDIILNGTIKVFILFVIKGIDIRENNDKCLRSAAKNNRLDIIEYMFKYRLSKDAQVEAIHSENDYALRHASRNGHTNIVKFLLENGANKHAMDDYAIRYANKNNYKEIVSLLK